MNARITAACAAVACLAMGAGIAGAHGGAHPGAPESPRAAALAAVRGDATVLIRPLRAGGPMGVARLTQRGGTLRGFIVMWGLAPGSRHAEHVHGSAVGGPVAACAPAGRRTTRHLADLPDLVADANGVAFGVIRERVTERAVRRGVYLMVHRDPTTAGAPMVPGANPPLACGALR
ncbi:superoxide dismutase family protein [Miltoncostaea marina]|uniref:superoxide dismutase family protein n=1 Tax=Miltoncostaea marina TaxID=2843215 RepID=UPI001C3C83C7|nr:superoxide dismutase family protein [Miltoncostaea marina]